MTPPPPFKVSLVAVASRSKPSLSNLVFDDMITWLGEGGGSGRTEKTFVCVCAVGREPTYGSNMYVIAFMIMVVEVACVFFCGDIERKNS